MPKVNDAHKALILEGHIRDGISLRSLERANGLANGCLSAYARRHNIPVRSKRDQARLDVATGRVVYPSGKDHWGYGLTKDTHHMYAGHSKRMTEQNPASDPEVIARALATKAANGFGDKIRAIRGGIPLKVEQRQKVAKSISAFFRENPSQRENMMREALVANDDRWVCQYHFDCAVLDFARPDILVAFEPDVGSHKLQRAASRDAALVAKGWTIFRFRCDEAVGPEYFTHAIAIAAQVVPDLQIPHHRPARASKYRVVIRCPENPAGFEVRDTNDPILKTLALRFRND